MRESHWEMLNWSLIWYDLLKFISSFFLFIFALTMRILRLDFVNSHSGGMLWFLLQSLLKLHLNNISPFVSTPCIICGIVLGSTLIPSYILNSPCGLRCFVRTWWGGSVMMHNTHPDALLGCNQVQFTLNYITSERSLALLLC